MVVPGDRAFFASCPLKSVSETFDGLYGSIDERCHHVQFRIWGTRMITTLSIIFAIIVASIAAVASANSQGVNLFTTLILVTTIAVAAVVAVVSASSNV